MSHVCGHQLAPRSIGRFLAFDISGVCVLCISGLFCDECPLARLWEGSAKYKAIREILSFSLGLLMMASTALMGCNERVDDAKLYKLELCIKFEHRQ